MNDVPQVKYVSTNDYINEINKSIESRNYLSAFVISLMIPDICSKHWTLNRNSDEKAYIKWFNKYVYRKYYNFPKKNQLKKVKNKYMYKIKFTGETCYALRNAILHAGDPYISYKKTLFRIKANVDRIELCVNSLSERDKQYGEGVSITRSDGEIKSVIMRINIINFAEKMISGYNDYLLDNNKQNIELFTMIDWDK